MELNDFNIHTAVNIWITNQQEAINKYGLIQDWDVSKVTNMNGLFKDMKIFNDDINADLKFCEELTKVTNVIDKATSAKK
jgi:hypothetical protein